MNIDYSKIIEKANTRKDVLINLEAQLEQAADMTGSLREIITWTGHLADTFQKLDAEGRELLPRDVRAALENNIRTLSFLRTAHGDPSMRSGVSYLSGGQA